MRKNMYVRSGTGMGGGPRPNLSPMSNQQLRQYNMDKTRQRIAANKARLTKEGKYTDNKYGRSYHTQEPLSLKEKALAGAGLGGLLKWLHSQKKKKKEKEKKKGK